MRFFEAEESSIPDPGGLSLSGLGLRWSEAGVVVQAEHLEGSLRCGEGDILVAQLSSSRRTSSRWWWLGDDGEDAWIHLRIRMNNGLNIVLSAASTDAEVEGLPQLERAGYEVDVEHVRGLFRVARLLGAKTPHQSARLQPEDHSERAMTPRRASSPVRWPPGMEPPPAPPQKWKALHDEDVTGLCFNPEASLLATTSRDGTARSWSMASGKQHQAIQHNASLNAIACSPIETLWAIPIPNDNRIVLLNEQSSHRSVALHHYNVQGIDFSPSGRHLAAACVRGLSRWTLNEREAVKFNPDIEAWSVAWGPSERLFVGVQGGDVVELSPTTLETLAVLGGFGGGRVHQLAVSFDGQLLAALRKERGVKIWDIASGEEINRIDGPISAICWTARGDLAIGLRDATLRLWSSASGESSLARGSARIQALAASADGHWLAWGDDAGGVVLWDVVRHQAHVKTGWFR